MRNAGSSLSKGSPSSLGHFYMTQPAREAQMHIHEICRRNIIDEHMLHTAIKVYAHLHAVNALVVEDAMVIKSGAWLAKL